MTNNSSGAVWVFAEKFGHQIADVSLELIGHARKLADELETTVEVVLLGDNVTEISHTLISAGADKVYLGDDPELVIYQPDRYIAMILELVREGQPEILLMGSTFMGRELAPLLAANLKTGLTAHCMDLMIDDNQILVAKIPAYGGMISIICPEKRPQMATVARGVFPKPILDDGREGEVVSLEIPEVAQRVEILEVVREEQEGVPLESAPIVVAGGAGAGCPEGWDEISQLAEALNAALGSTRPAVDEGWIELETMIGQSGKMVSPELYIGVGLSGELQHMVGIADAQVMVAINNDPKAPVFEQVDYGIVEDCREFVPLLTEKIKQYKERN
jgi:electron transfer flavoprotein alpha subunit